MKYRVIETALGPVPQYQIKPPDGEWKDISAAVLDLEAAKAEVEKHRKKFAGGGDPKVLWEG